MSSTTLQQPPTIHSEVLSNQSHLRTRLTNALTAPPPNTHPSTLPTIPLIDLQPSFTPSLSARKSVAHAIRAACTTSGFFQISNHGIPETAITAILTQARRFFHDLTPAQKDTLNIRHSLLFRGYEAAGDSYVNPDDKAGSTTDSENETESKEGFNWGYETSLDPEASQLLGESESSSYVELDGRPPSAPDRCNVWPDENVLPGFKAGVAEYYGHVLALARHLFRLFALSLDLEETYFDALTTHPGGIGRLLYYPPQTAAQLADKASKLGLGAHTDYECFTLLLSTSHPGLEILFPPSEATDNKPIWRPCPVRPGTITVNVADFLMRWTNGLYKSTIHRVVSRPVVDVDPGTGQERQNGSEARYSVPFFFSINYDADVEPLPVEAVGESRFANMKAGEYVLERLKATV